jgi:hypothetical protein
MRVFLDACVLFPSVLREILTGLAARGGFQPLWSERVLTEWLLATGRLGPEANAHARAEIARMRTAFPAALCPPAPDLEAQLDLPDAADKHVLASAAQAKAALIVTFNLRDFPSYALFAHALRAQSPDDFLMALWLAQPALVESAVAEVVAQTEAISGRPQPVRALLKRASLPRLGKALG